MAATTLTGVRIRGIAAAVPTELRLNSDIGEAADREYVEKLSSQVGVSQRRIVSPNQYGSDLGFVASSSLLSNLEWDPATIDMLVVATQTPDRLFPGTSFMLHRQLGLPQETPVFDINLGCSAFTHGIWTAGSLLAGIGRRALLVNVDTMSRTLGCTDWGNQVLFGDSATATALEFDEAAPPINIVLISDGKGTESVCLPNSGMQAARDVSPEFVINGPAVLGLALRSVPKLIDELLAHASIHLEDVGLFVPHQANRFILDKLAAKLGISHDRIVIAMDHYGNTSSASIPLALCAQTSQVNSSDRQRTLMVGFGTGFSLSAVLADLRATTFVAPIDVPPVPTNLAMVEEA